MILIRAHINIVQLVALHTLHQAENASNILHFLPFFVTLRPLICPIESKFAQKNAMKVVIASIVLPYPLTSGGAQGVFNMVEELRRDNEITLCFPENAGNTMAAMHELQRLWPDVDLRPYSYLRQMRYPRFVFDKAIRAFNLHFRADSCRFQVHRLLDHYGYYMTRDFSDFINGIVREKEADLVQVEFYPYLKIADLLPKDVKKVFVHHELRSVRNDRFLQGYTLTRKEQRLRDFIAAEEVEDLNKYDAVIALTENDKNTLLQKGVRVPLFHSPLAISTPALRPQPWKGRLLFLGGYAHTPNQEGLRWLLSEVAPLIEWDKVHRCSGLDLVGKDWTQEWVDHANHSPLRITIHGFVEHLEDVARGSIMVVPILSGSGMRMKILEGAALANPIVTTSVGVEGMDMKDGESCLIADTPQEFALALTRLMTDKQLRMQLCNTAQEIFECNYSRLALSHRRQEIWKSVMQ